MTACKTVADVLALAPNPARVSCREIRRQFGHSNATARLLQRLACERHFQLVCRRMAEFGISAQLAGDLLDAEWHARQL